MRDITCDLIKMLLHGVVHIHMLHTMPNCQLSIVAGLSAAVHAVKNVGSVCRYVKT